MSETDRMIEKGRSEIDQIDQRILDLLNERARCVISIGQAKQGERASAYVPGRELDILERLEARNPGPLPGSAVRNIFREIISASYSLEHGLRVAYLGPAATYTHQASLQQFGHMAELVPVVSIDEIFEAVESQRVEYGVVPVENSSEGVVSHTLDLFVESPLTICAEVHVAIHHDLLSQSGDLRAVRAVHSHPQALAQCRRWLAQNLPDVPQHSTPSTAQAAERAARDPEIAAVASPVAAEIYHLRVAQSGIEDNPNNTTRFLVIGRNPTRRSARDITSILFSIKRDQVGALYRALEPFARHDVNLTRIESRPTRVRAWEYVFFCDFEGHLEDPEVEKAIEELRPRCDFVKVLGSYPRAEGS